MLYGGCLWMLSSFESLSFWLFIYLLVFWSSSLAFSTTNHMCGATLAVVGWFRKQYLNPTMIHPSSLSYCVIISMSSTHMSYNLFVDFSSTFSFCVFFFCRLCWCCYSWRSFLLLLVHHCLLLPWFILVVLAQPEWSVVERLPHDRSSFLIHKPFFFSHFSHHVRMCAHKAKAQLLGSIRCCYSAVVCAHYRYTSVHIVAVVCLLAFL